MTMTLVDGSGAAKSCRLRVPRPEKMFKKEELRIAQKHNPTKFCTLGCWRCSCDVRHKTNQNTSKYYR